MIRFRDEAVVELNEAIDWYLARSINAAEKFKDSLSSAIANIELDPKRFSVIHLDFRYARIFGFPYIVVYQQRSDHVLILAVAHTRRRERYWLERG